MFLNKKKYLQKNWLLHLLTHHMKIPLFNYKKSLIKHMMKCLRKDMKMKKILLKHLKKLPKKSIEMKKILLKNMNKWPRKRIKMKKNVWSFLP